ncbi:indolepyruvate/phenylpyruvate decarboxylase [Rhodovibrionaceae bacterium A322]
MTTLPKSPQVPLAELLIDALIAEGAEEIFGIPGDFALPFFKVLEESGKLPLYTLSHEPAVGFAADAAARFSGRIGVAAVTYGAGAFNLVNTVATALAERSPLVVISGAPGKAESQSGLLLHHQAKTLDSQFRVFQELTCDQARLDDARTAPAEIARVLRSARELSQPVYIEVPRDMVAVLCDPVPPLPNHQPDPQALSECADEILTRLEAATHPVLLIDVEIRRYGLEDKLVELARRLNLPVFTTFMGRGLLSVDDNPLVGTYLGAAGDPEITRLVEQSDALLMLGVIVCDTNFGVSEKQIDLRGALQVSGREVKIGHHLYPDMPLDALMDTLLSRLPVSPRAVQSTPNSSPCAPEPLPTGLIADDAPIEPQDIVCAVNDLLARTGDRPILSDVGDCLFAATDIKPVPFAACAYYAGMGFAVPGALGAQAATGQRPLVLVGDGAFQMTGWELGNCQRLGLDPIVIVFNNATWEMLRVFQPESAFNQLGQSWDYSQAATALGGTGHKVSTRQELEAALTQADSTRGQFQLIEVMLTPGSQSERLQKFVSAQKARRAGLGEAA